MRLFKRLVISLVAILFISMFMAFPILPTAATTIPQTARLEAVPSVISAKAGDIVAIDIYARDVVEDWDIIGFQFCVPFETEWLAPWVRVKGDFMEAFVNGGEELTTPNPLYQVVSDIPYKPNWALTKAMVMILPDPNGQYHAPFPRGEGRLITLQYKALKDCEMNIEIINTIVLDICLRDITQFDFAIIAVIDLDPDTLNLKSKGQWVTAYIELSEGYDVNDIDVSSITLNCIPVDPRAPYAIGDHDKDGVPDLMVMFSRATATATILAEGITFGSVTLTLRGQVTQGHAILGSDTIRVRMPGDVNSDGKVDMRDISAAGRAYGSSPENPRWNYAADENEDNIIDMKDIVTTVRLFGTSY